MPDTVKDGLPIDLHTGMKENEVGYVSIATFPSQSPVFISYCELVLATKNGLIETSLV